MAWIIQDSLTLAAQQFGSRSLRGVVGAARVAHHHSALYAAQEWKSAAVFLDITKAYDRVHTGLLICKLQKNPFSSLALIRWLCS
jgi:hypothetical protein